MNDGRALADERTPGRPDTSIMTQSAELRAIRSLDEQLQRMVERAAALVGASRGSLLLLDPFTQTLITAAAFQGPAEQYQTNPLLHEAIARWVLAHRSTAVSEDLAADPRAQVPGVFAAGSLLSVPLIARQQVLGALTVSSPYPGTFRPPHLHLLETLADLAAAITLQARQLEAAAQHTRYLNMLLDTARALLSAREDQQVFGALLATIQRLVRCNEAVIFHYDAQSGMLHGVAGLGVQGSQATEQHISITDPQSITAWVAQHRRPLLHSPGARAFVGQVTDSLASRQEMALLATPLMGQEQLWGVITLARPAAFDTNDLRTMLALSAMAVQALAHTGREAAG